MRDNKKEIFHCFFVSYDVCVLLVCCGRCRLDSCGLFKYRKTKRIDTSCEISYNCLLNNLRKTTQHESISAVSRSQDVSFTKILHFKAPTNTLTEYRLVQKKVPLFEFPAVAAD